MGGKAGLLYGDLRRFGGWLGQIPQAQTECFLTAVQLGRVGAEQGNGSGKRKARLI